MQVSGHIIVSLERNGVDGKDGITWSVPSSLIMPAGETMVQFNVGAYRDGSQLITDASQIIVRQTPTGASGCSIVSVNDSYGATMQLTRSEVTTDVNGELILFTTVDGVQYTSRIQVSSVFDGVGATVYPENVTFRETRNKVTAYVIVTDGDERVSTSAWSMSVPSAPTGVTATVTDGDTYRQIDFERTDTSASIDSDYNLTITYGSLTFERTIHIMSIENGVDGIMWGVPAIVSFAPDATYLSFYVGAWRDGKQLVTNTTQIKIPTELGEGITGVAPRTVDEEQGVLCEVIRSASAEINWTGVWGVTIEGNTYTFSVTVISVKNGTDGAKGDKGDTGTSGSNGDDAVTYELEASSNNLVWYPARGAYSPNTITLTYYKVTGSTRAEQNAYWSGEVVLDDGTEDGATYSIGSTQAGQTNATSGTSTYVFRPANCTATVKSFRISAHVGTLEDSTAKEFALQTTSSYGVRVQMWDDLPTGYEFENGTLGCSFLDFVVYGSNNNYYQCVTRHTKTSDNYPTSTTATNSNLWTQISKMESVATNVLLANTAKINNLYVDDVYMESTGDKPTAVWISPEHDGMKILKMGSDWQAGRENTNNNSGWSNPTTWFHGGDIPDPSEVFTGGSGESTGDLPAWTVEQNNASELDYISDTVVESSKSAAISVKALALTNIKISGQSVTINIKDSDVSSVTSLAFSQINMELRLYDGEGSSRYIVLASASASGDGTSNTFNRTWSINVDTQFTPKNGEVYTCWAYTYLGLRSGASVSISKTASSNAVNISYLSEGYVSQFGANGVFIGRNTNSYFRLLMGDNEQRHTLLSNGYGLDVTGKGVLQYFDGNKMPVGGTLLLGYFIVSSSVRGTVWTFDGQAPTLTYLSTGCWRIASPDWGSTLGASSSNAFCVTVTPTSGSSSIPYLARAYNLYVNDNGNFEVSIATYNDTTLADVSCFVRIDFIGTGTNTFSVTSLNADGTQGIAQENENNNNNQMED